MHHPARRRGILFVVSAPSGAGKSTLVRRLVENVPGIEFSVSYTTRPRRPGERNGREYHFVSDARFDAMVAEDGFLEWAQVFDRRYGTGRVETERVLAEGRDLVLDIDVQGAAQVRARGTEPVCIFLMPPDYPSLVARLKDRRSEDPTQLRRRLSQARREAEGYTRYDYLVVNDDLDRAAGDLTAIVEAQRCRISTRRAEAERILATFPVEGESQ